MSLKLVQEEFLKRYRRWACQDFEREIEQGFPFLKGFKSGPPLVVVDMMSRMRRTEQIALASALIKHFHKNGFEAAGDRLTSDETIAYQEYRHRVVHPEPLEIELLYKAAAGERGVYADKRKLIRHVRLELESVGMKLFEEENLAGVISYENRLEGWRIITRIHTHERHAQLAYDHSIWSTKNVVPITWSQGTWREGQKELWPMQLHNWISLAAWLGISSRTEWSDLVDSDIAHIAKSLAALCRHFIAASSVLLTGLHV